MSETGYQSRTVTLMVWASRVVLAAGAAVALWQGELAYARFVQHESSTFGFAWGTYALAMGLLALAGAAFTLAARLPFSLRGLAWAPLLLALVAAVPALHFAAVWVGAHRHWHSAFSRFYWFDGGAVTFVAASLVGVGIASAIGSRRNT